MMSVKEAAREYGVHYNTFYEMLRVDKSIPRMPHGSRILIPRDLYFDWLEQKVKAEVIAI